MILETMSNMAPHTVRSYALVLYHMIQEQLEFSLGFEGLFVGSQETTDPEILDSARAAIIYTLYEKVGVDIGINMIASELNIPIKTVSEIISMHELRISSLAKKYRIFRNILRDAPIPEIKQIVVKEKPVVLFPKKKLLNISEHQAAIVRPIEKIPAERYTYDLFCEELFQEIERQTGFSKIEITTKSRLGLIPECRFIFCVVSKICFPKIQLRIIGEKIGGKDHTTILHAFKAHLEYMTSKDDQEKTHLYKKIYKAISTTFFEIFSIDKNIDVEPLLFHHKFKKNLSEKEIKEVSTLFLQSLSQITGIPVDTITHQGRKTVHVTIRQVYIHLMRTYYSGVSEKDIAATLGYHDHSTISHHINQITDFLKQPHCSDKKVLQFIDIRDRMITLLDLS